MMWTLSIAARAWDGVPQWDDPAVDRAPREQTASLAQGFVFGPTDLSVTRLQLGLTPLSLDRVGLGLTASTQLQTTSVSGQGRMSAALGNTTGSLHLWLAPRNRPRTSHDLFAGFGAPVEATSYWLRVEDALTAFHLGYAGYYDVTSTLDVSLDVRGHLGFLQNLAPGYGALWAAGNLTVYGSPNKERWVALAGVDASFTTVAALAGLRARIGPHVEFGGAVAVPLVSSTPLDGELPLWPSVDLRLRL